MPVKKITTGFKTILVVAILAGAFGIYQTVTATRRGNDAIVIVKLPGDGKIMSGRNMHITVRVGGRWEVRDHTMTHSPWMKTIPVPEGQRIHVRAVERQERWAFLIISCSIHNNMGQMLDENQGSGDVQCESLI